MTVNRGRKRLEWLKWAGKRFAVLIVPSLYISYMWLVYHTSKRTYIEIPKLWEMTARGKNALGAVWHQDGFISPFCLRGHNILTMVSHSSLGNILTVIFRKCRFITIRGGSAKGGMEALSEIIDYINTHDGVFCGIAVDGSRGPARKARMGLLLIAQATGVPIYPMRAWAKRKLLAPTWDQTLVPLPFNHLVFMLGDPISVPSEAEPPVLEKLRRELEQSLNELADRSERFFQDEIKR